MDAVGSANMGYYLTTDELEYVDERSHNVVVDERPHDILVGERPYKCQVAVRTQG